MKLLAALVILVMSALAQVAYLRAHRRPIDESRPAARSVRSFRVVYPVVMVVLFVVGLDLLLTDGVFTSAIEPPPPVVATGMVLLLLGMVLFVWARKSLGEHYSPCYASRLPHAIVRHGAYRWFAHPIYVGNLTGIGGAVLVSGAPLLAATWLVVAVSYWRAARLERAELAHSAPAHTASADGA